MPLYLACFGRTGRIMNRETRGVQLHYVTDGNGEQKVLLLHGWGCDISLMKPVADTLCENCTTLIPDLPGHGESGRPPEPWGVDRRVDRRRVSRHVQQNNLYGSCGYPAQTKRGSPKKKRALPARKSRCKPDRKDPAAARHSAETAGQAAREIRQPGL